MAAAAPKEDNKNALILPVDCEGLGAFEIIGIQNALSSFGPDGQVFVLKRISGDVSFTITTFDEEVFGPFSDTFEDAVNGKGFEDRLVPCSFTQTFTETFTLDAGAADFFGIPPTYVGTEVTFEGIVDGTRWVLMPGK